MTWEKVTNVVWKAATSTMFGFTLLCFGLVGWETKNFIQNFSSWSAYRVCIGFCSSSSTNRQKQREIIAKEIVAEQNEEEERDREIERILGIARPQENVAMTETIKSDTLEASEK